MRPIDFGPEETADFPREPLLPFARMQPVKLRKDRAVLHRPVLLDGTDMFQECVARFGMSGQRQYGFVEDMHQAMHLAQQQCTDHMAARFGPHGTAAAKERA
jgi:hypothetical protein